MHHSGKSTSLFVCSVIVALLGAGEPPCHDAKPTTEQSRASLRFDRLKGLVGEWELAGGSAGAQKDKLEIRYHLTAGGSALVETIHPGDGSEMISVFCRDRDQLALTHYCHLGNQPRMRTKTIDDTNELEFEFDGGGNLDPATETHMHSMRMKLVDSDHFRCEWRLFKNGKSAQTMAFDLVRKK
jgi:hypothetical protein